ncbi:MAG TPA: hypothetical protein PLL53_05930 [Saprospiraceae bacterium]|jgi:hypothetical protein|nr:hypothetical protein [Saprospiraceae bacterium]
MLNRIIILAAVVGMALGCNPNEDYTLGDLTPPTNIAINAEIVGQTTATPNGDGSGDVKFTITADGALNYRIDYDAADGISLDNLPTGKATRKYTKLGTNTYLVTVVAYGKGGSSSTATKEITVQSNFTPDASIINNLTGGSSKTWVVDQSVPGHFGVGPWSDGSSGPDWWSAAIDEKVACCNCFYTAQFKFNKIPGGYSLDVTTPDGAFTKTGSLAGGLPGIPGSGGEGCYAYGGGSGSFSFVPSSTGIPASAPSTKTAIQLSGANTFIGYGALQKEFEIMVLTSNYMYLRAQGTETGNAWYLKLKAL